MRVVMPAVALAAGAAVAAFGAPIGLAQSSTSYPYCLMTEDAQDCSYYSIAQCQASKRGNTDFCMPNNTYPANTTRLR